jgi:indole-3-glycerol phosphate synthase
MGVLEEILRRKRERLSHVKTCAPLKELKARIGDMKPPLNFRGAIRRLRGPEAEPAGIRLIAEIKKASPSKGIIRADFDPVRIAEIYQGRADALSVLTEEDFFLGELGHIGRVKGVTDRPVLRKDFIVEEYQLYESRAAGADAMLLIGAALGRAQAEEFCRLAEGLGLQVLFEVHGLEELETALLIGADIIGINNRDLRTMAVDLGATFEMKREIPESKTVVSESGIRTRQDVLRLEEAGVDAMLVGTAFMEAPDIGEKMDELRGLSEGSLSRDKPW